MFGHIEMIRFLPTNLSSHKTSNLFTRLIVILTGFLLLMLTLPVSQAQPQTTPLISATASELMEPQKLITETGKQELPKLLFNPQSNEYLLVVEGTHIGNNQNVEAYRLNSNGLIVGSKITVAADSVFEGLPNITIDENTGDYFVVYQRSTEVTETTAITDQTDVDIMGQVVGKDGQILSSPIIVSNRPGRQLTPAVGYCAEDKNLLAIWSEDLDAQPGPWDFFVYGRTISTTTSMPFGKVFTATGDYPDPGFQQITPHLICKPWGDECLLVFRDSRDPDRGSKSNDDIYAQRLACDGRPIVPSDFPVTVQYSEAPGGNKQNAPVGAYSSQSDLYLIVWTDDRDDEDINTINDAPGNVGHRDSANIYGQFLLGNGVRISTAIDINFPIATADHNQLAPAIAYSEADDLFLVVWTDYRNRNGDIYGQLISGSGHLIGSNFALTNDPANQLAPTIAYNSANEEFLIAWEDRSNSMGTSVDIHGTIFKPNLNMQKQTPVTSFNPTNVFTPPLNFGMTWQSWRYPPLYFNYSSPVATRVWVFPLPRHFF